MKKEQLDRYVTAFLAFEKKSTANLLDTVLNIKLSHRNVPNTHLLYVIGKRIWGNNFIEEVHARENENNRYELKQQEFRMRKYFNL